VSLTELGTVLRTIFGNAATAFAILVRKFPPFMAFSEGFAIGLCVMFLLVLYSASMITYTIILALSIVLGFASMALEGIGAVKAANLPKLMSTLYELFVKYPEITNYVRIKQIVMSVAKSVIGVFGISTAFVHTMLGLGALATVLACIYTVKPPVKMNRVIWIVSGLAGYFAAFGTVGLAAMRDTINTVFWTAFNVVLPVLIVEIIDLVMMIIIFIISTFAESFFAFAYEFISRAIMVNVERATRAIILVSLVGFWSFLIVVYFSALGIVTAIFTNIITTVFQALGKRGETAYPGFAYFTAMLLAVVFAGIVIPLVLYGMLLILALGIMIFVTVKILFAANVVAKLILAPEEVIKNFIENTTAQTIWSAFVGWLYYDVVRLVRRGAIEAAKKLNANPQIIAGMTTLFTGLTLMSLIGLPGSMIISMIYINGLPILVMTSLLHACVAGPPTRMRGATAASGIILNSITFLLILGMIGAMLLYTIVPPNAIIDISGVGLALKKYVLNSTVLSKGFYTDIVQQGASVIYKPINNLNPKSRLITNKFLVMPYVALSYIFTPGKNIDPNVIRYMLDTRCSFTYSIFKALGQNYTKYIEFEYRIYEAVESGQATCKLPTGEVMPCNEVAKKLGEEYFCTFIFYKVSQMH